MKFPVYRKYPHNKTFFRINSENDFEELNLIGKAYTLRHFTVKIFSDRVFIKDMLENTQRYWIEISEEEYENQQSYCMENLNRI